MADTAADIVGCGEYDGVCAGGYDDDVGES